MQFHPIIERSQSEALPLDPSHYLRLADLALLYGSRDEAEALVTMAYLAFDLMLGESQEITELRKVWPGRSN
jgi:hypothetical protein